jgi:GntR family transcriptional regulator
MLRTLRGPIIRPSVEQARKRVMSAVEPSKTRRLYLLLRERIRAGAVAPGARLPSEPELAIQHGVSRVTVRRALEGLEREGLIRRQPGAGTFVLGGGGRKPVVGDLADMMAHLRDMGRASRVTLLEFGYELPPPDVAKALRLAPDERTQRSVRVRRIEDTPFSYLVTHVPERIGRAYSQRDLSTTPLLTLLERCGVVAERASQRIGATLAGPEVAAALATEVGAPLLSINRVVFDANGVGVEHLSALYRPDLYNIEMELMRIGRGPNRRWSTIGETPRTNGAAAPGTEST